MKNRIVAGFLVATLFTTTPARADMFGGDIAVLAQILANAIQQLAQLKAMVDSTKSNLELLREVHRGIDAVTIAYESQGGRLDPSVLRNLSAAGDALREIQRLQGAPVNSSGKEAQGIADMTAAQAVSFGSGLQAYTQNVDRIGEQIKRASATTSQRGAEKLTAQSLGVLVHVVNQTLKTQQASLQIQAQSLLAANRTEKEFSAGVQAAVLDLKTTAQRSKPTFNLPRL